MRTSDTAIEKALTRLAQTRTRLIVRCSQTPEPDTPSGDESSAGSALTAMLTGWLTNELMDRLNNPSAERPGIAASLTEGIQPALAEWVKSHPWLGVTAGLAAGSLAVSQHRRVFKWALVSVIPWLTTQLGAAALPLILQWVARKGLNQGADQFPATPAATAGAGQAPAQAGDLRPND